ncbi:MAG: M23 family metallopeptidase [bacterium]
MLPWAYPVDNPSIVKDGGYCIPPRPDHAGLDFHAPEGTPVHAVDDGIVVNVGEWNPAGTMDAVTKLSGNFIILAHSNNLISSYSHLSSKVVKKGEKVKRGQTIGHSGHTGYVRPAGIEGAHLHFAKRVLTRSGWVFADPTGDFESAKPIAESVSTHPQAAAFQKEASMPAERSFDEIFKKYLGEIPLAFARAITWPWNPSSDVAGSVGLFQITDTVRESFNKFTGSTFSKGDLKDPNINSRIGLWLLCSIVQDLSTKHPVTMKMNWADLRYAGLIAQAYHTGQASVSGLIGKLEAQKIPADRITVDTVKQAATVSGSAANTFTADPKRLEYVRGIVSRYAAQADFPGTKPKQPVIYMDPVYITAKPLEPKEPSGGSGGGGLIAALMGGFVVLAVAVGGKKKRK